MNTKPKPLHIVIDIETLGTKPGCKIASIGAVAFRDLEDLQQPQLDEPWDYKPTQFYSRVIWKKNSDSALEGDTVAWWLTQKKKARAELTSSDRETLRDALIKLVEWLIKVRKGNATEVYCWSQGDFDFPILNAAFKSSGSDTPWKYWECMDLRTLRKTMGLFPHPALVPQQIPDAIPHHAYWDAYAQAVELQQILTHLDINLMWPTPQLE